MGTPRDLSGFLGMLSQGFGENPAMYQPLGLKGHNGLDWPTATGTEVYASHDGLLSYTEDAIIVSGYNRGRGVTVTGTECKTIFWHLMDSIVPLNGTKYVSTGDLIGHADNTGFSTGSHLHYGLKLLKDGNVLNRDNGYDGAVDPTPYLVWFGTKKPMTKNEVRQLQALEGYKDEAGVAYWTGKPLSDYLKARLQDKIKTINESL
jgi:murein DD-endopeptidase MepM/ murein hydrolase activator NlpD